VSTNLNVDRFCTTATDDLYWNESCWFSFSIPEKEIHAMVYYFFRPNMNLLQGGPIVWDGTGAHTWDCLYHDWHHFQSIPEGGEKFDFKSHTSLEVRVVEPQRQYRLGYDQPDFKMNLLWTAIEPPHHFLGMEIEATGMSAENRMHLEQMGRVTGTIVLRGEEMSVDCYTLRDTSWGVRQMDGVKRGSYFWAVADDDNAFHAQVMGEGDEMRAVGGFIKLDGKTSSIIGGKRVVTEMGDVTPRLFDLSLEDEMGRTLEVKARSCSDLMVNFYPRVQVVWSLLEVDFGGGTKGWGDIQEFQPMEQFRAMVRGGR
jgi:hypothetical protein